LEAIVAGAALIGCGLSTVPRAKEVAALPGKSANGAGIYDADCRSCHGADGKGGNRSEPNAMHHTMLGALRVYSAPEMITLMIQGRDKMPGFARYSDQQLADVYAYVLALPR
jgi:mono/diheme cytochrome c family protein